MTIMDKLQVRLLALVLAGTIFSSEKVASMHPDSTSLVLPSASPTSLDCRPPKSVNVRFNELKVPGPDSDVVYQRMTVSDALLQFAANATISLPSTNIAACAKAATAQGLGAFEYNGTCLGYILTSDILQCQTGDRVVFVRPDSLVNAPVAVPLEEAPSKLISSGDRTIVQYMLISFVGNDVGEKFVERKESLEDYDDNDYDFFITLENGDSFSGFTYAIDINFCLSGGAYGLPVFPPRAIIAGRFPKIYFLNECGNTITVPNPSTFELTYMSLLIQSHEGFGCTFYPSDATDPCTVTLTTEGRYEKQIVFGFYMSEPAEACAGLNMTVTAGDDAANTVDACRSMSSPLQHSDTFTISLQQHPSKRAIGFAAYITD